MNSVRIIGGMWRRRVLRFPDSTPLRPTPDRVRETLFNWLGQDLTGLACLDLFAGSGALGFEALSRGASRVVLVENASQTLAALKKNAQTLLPAPGLRIIDSDAVEFTLTVQEPCFDVLFFDPPYRQGWIERFEPLLFRLMKEGACLYVEAEREIRHWGDWRAEKSGRAGQVYFHLMRRNHPNGAE